MMRRASLAVVAAELLRGSSCLLAQTRIPPSIEFRVPKAPAVASSDSGAFLVYELHVTNLTANPMRLRRVGVTGGSAKGSTPIMTLDERALPGVISRPGFSTPPAEPTQIGPGMRAVVYLWLQVDEKNPPATLT